MRQGVVSMIVSSKAPPRISFGERKMKVSVVVPTYEERDNVKLLIERIARTLDGRDYEIVVVDDNSPDGTAEAAASLSQQYPIKVIQRHGKLGLASAISDGFGHSSGDIVGVIDADLQHPPELIGDLISAIEQRYDIALGSRLVDDGAMENWTLWRKTVSRGATLLARPLTEVKDPLSGYFFMRRAVIDGGKFKPIGYKLLLEVLVKGNYKQVKEVPYIFGTREKGKSKLGLDEYIKYLKLLCHLYLYKAKERLKSAK